MLHDPTQANFDQVDEVGFTLRRPGDDQYHVGFLFKTEDRVMVRHQCNHMDTREQAAANQEDLWTDISAVSLVNKAVIAARLAKVGDDKVPYGVGYKTERGYLDKQTLRYIVTKPGNGLTCATYIIAILETLGFVPFDHANWAPTLEDTSWQGRMVVTQAIQHPAAIAHFAAEQANVGTPRYKPEHVIASGTPLNWPISQDDANRLGAEARREYDEKRPR